MNNHQEKDISVLSLISKEFQKERTTISLIPSENIMSEMATSMYMSRSNNRYILPLQIGNEYYMPGRENLGRIIHVLEEKLCSIYERKHVLTKGLSGLHQMDILMSALRKRTDRIVILDMHSGGHSKTRGVATKYGFDVETLKLDFNEWDIDYKEFQTTVKKWKNEKVFVYIDHTVTVNPLNIDKLMKAIPADWIVYYDISHLQLFYFTHVFTFPKNQNFFFGGSMHKSFPGPQKAIILLDNDELFTLINTEFTQTTSSVHTGSLLALLITVLEMEQFGSQYIREIIDKTRYFAKLLDNQLDVIGPRPYLTNTHQICIDVPNIVEITQKLAAVGIVTTPMRTPSKNRSGIRLGIQELCRTGVTDDDLVILSEIVISCVHEEKINKSLRVKVEKMAKKLFTPKYVLPHFLH